MTEAPKKPEHRVIALVLAIIAAGGLGFAAMSKKWLYNPRTIGTAEEVSMGPRGTKICSVRRGSEGQCVSMSNAALVAAWRKDLADAQKTAREDPNNSDAVIVAEKLAKNLHTSSAWSPFGWIALGSCLLAALAIAIAAVLVVAKKRVTWPIMPTTISLLSIIVALVSGPVFAALKPGPAGFVGVSDGFYAFAIGIIAGLAGSLMLNRVLRPVDADYFE